MCAKKADTNKLRKQPGITKKGQPLSRKYRNRRIGDFSKSEIAKKLHQKSVSGQLNSKLNK